MKKSAFTMIEMIFVIVILGILAAVGLPKLAATRDDAKNSRRCHDISVCIMDAGTYYTAKGTDITDSKACQSTGLTPSGGKLIVSNSPSFCLNLNGIYNFGGTAVLVP